jgi:hypothetical protein
MTSPALPYFSTLFHNGTISGGAGEGGWNIEHKIYVSIN